MSDGSDFLAWQRNFGKSWEDLAIPSTPAAATVPEPAATTLGAMALLGFAFVRKWRAKSALSIFSLLGVRQDPRR